MLPPNLYFFNLLKLKIMKRKLLIMAFLIMASCLAKAQTPSSDRVIAKPKTFVIKLNAVKKTAFGYLAGMNDTMIKFSFKHTALSDSIIEKQSYNSYHYSEIMDVKIRKYGSITRGICIGGLVGAAFGILMEPVVSNELTFGTFGGGPVTSVGSGNLLTGLISGLITGAIIGGIAGSGMRKFKIHRDKKKFRDMKSDILQRYFRPSRIDSSLNN